MYSRGVPYRRPYPGQGQYVQRPPQRGAPQTQNVYGLRSEQTSTRNPALDSLNAAGKRVFSQVDRQVADVSARFKRHPVSQDFTHANCHYAGVSKEALGIPLDINLDFHLKEAGNCFAPEKAQSEPPKERHVVRVMLLSGAKKEDEDKTKAVSNAKVHLAKKLQFLLQKSPQGLVSAIGGEWSAEDGKAPNDEALKKTAIRVASQTAGLDLSVCKSWLKFIEFWYRRENEESTHVVFFLPDVWNHFVEEGLKPSILAREETKEVTEEVEEEVEGEGEDKEKKKVTKKVTVTKKVPVPILHPTELTLASLLDMDTRTASEELTEICLFADCFDEMLQRDFGMDIVKILKGKKLEALAEVEAEKKRKREAEELEEKKKQRTAEEEEAEAKKVAAEGEKKACEGDKPKVKVVSVVNNEILAPFQYFDRQVLSSISGHLRREVLELLLLQLGEFSKAQIEDLLAAVNLKKSAPSAPGKPSVGSPVLYYIKLATTTTEVAVEPEATSTPAASGPSAPAATSAPSTTPATTPASTPKEKEVSPDVMDLDEVLTEAQLSKVLVKDLREMAAKKGLDASNKQKKEVIAMLLGNAKE